ncbi:MAG TPA: glycogen debranching enzyme GlgX, partial [Ohtaekwangia sp.]|nr:glycogen debranching enzyme GlgX [Ohtaekwangia sp.]
MLGEFAQRVTGSPDLYSDGYRSPTASINFLTAHDGFTLHDLVSYNEKHNEANKEDNNDGESHNRSWNCGEEGPTKNAEVSALREKQKRNLLTTLFLSQGVPMLLAGDEVSNSQLGNNNAYCQDNDLSWINWNEIDEELLSFTTKLIHLRRDHPVFSRRGWFQGKPIKGKGVEDIAWFQADGTEMTEEQWSDGFAKSLGIFLNGKGFQWPDENGDAIVDDNFYIIFNAHHDALEFSLPGKKYSEKWQNVLDTSNYNVSPPKTHLASENVMIEGRSIVLLTSRLTKSPL